MSELRIRLDKGLAGGEIREGAVANVYPVGAATLTTAVYRDITIPAGEGMNFRAIQAAAGRYLIEAQLPNGEMVSEEVEVPSEGPPVEVRLRADKPWRTWLGWQQFASKVEKHQLDQLAGGRIANAFTWVKTRASLRYLLDPPSIETAPLANRYVAAGSGGIIWEALAGSLKQVPENPPWLGARQKMQPQDSDASLQSFVLTAAQLGLASQVPGTGDPRLSVERQYGLVRFGKTVELISIPCPWFDPEAERDCPIDLLVRDRVEPGAFHSSVMVRDSMLGSAMSFMTAGGLSNASFLFKQAKEMLYEKLVNPLAASAGGYVLVATQEGLERRGWHRWITMLMESFPWLPDGAIQYGRLRLRDEESDSDLEEARRALFMAYERGLPFFSAGIRWLLSGLTVFAEDGDAEAARMLKAVHRVSLRTDMSQPFTVVQLGPRGG